MIAYARAQSFTVLLATAFLFFASGLAHADPITPKTVTAGTSPTLTINSSGFFDLSKLNSSQISISPSSGVSKLQISNATPTSAAVTFDLSSSASAGGRMLVINTGDVNVSLKFTVASDRNKCTPANCHRPRVCEDDKCIVPARCNPACTPPKRCVQTNVCETPK